MQQYNFKHHTVLFDENTGDFELKEKECEHEYEKVRLTCSDGRTQLRRQCFKCFDLTSNSMSQSGVNMAKLKEAVKYEDSPKTKECEDLNKRLRIKRDAIQDKIYSDWDQERKEYYETSQWKQKRLEVLKRDGNTCQACLKNKAIQAHHTTYDHFKNEPLFDLVAVCISCHEKITQIDRANRKNKNL